MGKSIEFYALRDAAIAVLGATDAYRDAVNGDGHRDEPHDQALHHDAPAGAPFEMFDIVGDCAACGGAQYGTEDELHKAIGDLREAVGQPRRPWETRTPAQWQAAIDVVPA